MLITFLGMITSSSWSILCIVSNLLFVHLHRSLTYIYLPFLQYIPYLGNAIWIVNNIVACSKNEEIFIIIIIIASFPFIALSCGLSFIIFFALNQEQKLHFIYFLLLSLFNKSRGQKNYRTNYYHGPQHKKWCKWSSSIIYTLII